MRWGFVAYHGNPEESLLTLSGIGEQQEDGRGEFAEEKDILQDRVKKTVQVEGTPAKLAWVGGRRGNTRLGTWLRSRGFEDALEHRRGTEHLPNSIF